MGKRLDPPASIDVKSTRFQKLPLSTLQSVIVPVVVMRPDTITLVGTAFNIAPHGLYVTATHVIEEAISLRENHPGSWISVIWVGSGEGEDVEDLLGGQIPIVLAQISPNHDVALLQPRQILKNDEPVSFPALAIGTEVPALGSPILAIGYTKMDIETHRNSPELREVTADQACFAAHGTVSKLYPAGRDSCMIPFPAFESDARSDPGMSGGPVFSGDNSHVCGVVCTGISGDAEETVWTSFTSMMVNALVLDVKVDFSTDRTVKLYDLVRDGVVRADEGFDRIGIVENGGETTLSFLVPRSDS